VRTQMRHQLTREGGWIRNGRVPRLPYCKAAAEIEQPWSPAQLV